MEATGKVYKIINDINEKVYIGETSRNLDDRFSEHCFDKRSTTQIHKAIEKFGWQHFRIVEIETVPLSKIYEREKYWIEYYNSYNNGYNSTPDGKGFGNYRNYNSVLIKEPNIVFDSAEQMGREISQLTSWSLRFCVDKIRNALNENKKFLDFTLEYVKVPVELVSSIEDRENWIKNLNIQYSGKRLYSKELNQEFSTTGEAARYIYNNQLYITNSKYPIQTLITLIGNNLKQKNEGINTTKGLLTFEYLPGSTKNHPSNNDSPYQKVRVKCLELNKEFESQTEAANFMIDNEYWKKIKLKTAKLRISDMINGGVNSYKGYTFVRV